MREYPLKSPHGVDCAALPKTREVIQISVDVRLDRHSKIA